MSAVPALRAALDDASNDVKAVAAAALVDISPTDQNVIADVMKLLANNDRNVRASVAFALSRTGEIALPFLVEALADGRATVRAGSAYALSLMGTVSSSATAALTLLLTDTDEQVRSGAADASSDWT